MTRDRLVWHCETVPVSRINDVGGMQGFPPITAEADEAPFHADWEAHVFAMNRALLEHHERLRVLGRHVAAVRTAHGAPCRKDRQIPPLDLR